jgi:adenylate kinase
MKRLYFIFVGGINSSGKSTILKRIASKKIACISGSAYFMKWLKIKNGDYSKLQSLPDKKVLSELGKMMRYIVRQEKFGIGTEAVCIDAHYLNIRNGKAQPWVGRWLSLMDGIVFVRSSPVHILKRMKKDEKRTGRIRNVFKQGSSRREEFEQLRSFTEKNDLLFKKLLLMYNKPSAIITNNKRGVSVAAQRLKLFINKQIVCRKKAKILK